MKKRNVWLVEPNYLFGRNAFLPYAIARLWAYAMADPDIKSEYEVGGWVVFRHDIDGVLSAMELNPPDVLAASCYIWNIGYIEQLCKKVKQKYPKCLIIAGGPQVPDPKHFDGNSFADYLINGEGEVIFRDLLRDYADNPEVPIMPYHTGEKSRIPDLEDLVSPYLSGIFDDDEFPFTDSRYSWHALQETNRGCPYQCTFCDWGSATFSKVRQFPMEVIIDEIKWFEKNRIELLYNCDANFGMLKRDTDIARTLVASKNRSGFPDKFRAAYAKKTTPQVYETALILAKAEMSKGVTLSVQSMDKIVLETVKRRPIVEDEYRGLVADYKEHDVPTYTEIIIGLPNETLISFKDGIDRLLELGQHEGINIYPAILLQNSEMNDPKYRAEHEITTRRVPMLLLHGSPKNDPAPEMYDIVISTKTLSFDDWVDALVYGWVIQGLHCLGFLRQWAITLNHGDDGFKYSYIYGSLIYKSKILARIIRGMRTMLVDTITGVGNWNEVDPRFGPVTFPPEERLFMECVLHSDEIYGQLQVPGSLKKACRDEYVEPWEFVSLEEWARESVWYSRKGKRKKAA